MKTNYIITTPVHIKDKDHLNKFVESLIRINKIEIHPWHLDVNGCPNEINSGIINSFKDYPNITVHIEKKGGRPLSMNRLLKKARNETLPLIIFANDDLFYDTKRLPFKPILKKLREGHPLVAANSIPYDPEFKKNKKKAYQCSFSLIAEQYFFKKMLEKRGAHFRGDCFGMKTDFINLFPHNIAADDSFLSVLHQAKFNRKPNVVDSPVWREHEMSVKNALKRIQRYFEGRETLIDFFKEDTIFGKESKEYQVAKQNLTVPNPEMAYELFLREKEQLNPNEIRKLAKNKKFNEIRELLGPYANALICYQAAKMLNESEIIKLNEEGVVEWSRPNKER